MSDAKKDPPPLAAQLTKGIDSVDLHEFAGGIAQEMATLPQIRVGKKWYTTAQILTVLIPLGFVAGLCVVAFAQQIRTIPQVQAFIQEYPGTGRFSHPVQSGFPWWLRYQHYLNLFFMLLMIRSGLQILAARLDSERRHPRASEVAGVAGPTALDRPCPMVALQFGYALGVKRHRILHPSVLN